MTAPRYLIVNADDFGLSPGVNRGLIKAHEHGIVTSASLMVRWPGAAEAAAYGRAHPELSIGLHLDLGEWVFVDGAWRMAYEVVSLEDAAALTSEVARQLDLFRSLLGRSPTHLDAHQHVHRAEPLRSILRQEAQRLGVPLRDVSPQVRYCGDFYGQSDQGYPYPEGISVEALLAILRQLPTGWTELGCHPGEGTDFNSVYQAERSVECQSLCEPRVREVLREADIRLCSFSDPRLKDWQV
jgi:chitin disaccharide deacetylase